MLDFPTDQIQFCIALRVIEIKVDYGEEIIGVYLVQPPREGAGISKLSPAFESLLRPLGVKTIKVWLFWEKRGKFASSSSLGQTVVC